MTRAHIHNINRSHFLLPVSRIHYAIIKKKYGEKSHLLFTDTDSLMYEIETPDLHRQMIDMKDHFDLSNFDPFNPYYQPDFCVNKAEVGKMKDYASGNPISEFIRFRLKMYS